MTDQECLSHVQLRFPNYFCIVYDIFSYLLFSASCRLYSDIFTLLLTAPTNKYKVKIFTELLILFILKVSLNSPSASTHMLSLRNLSASLDPFLSQSTSLNPFDFSLSLFIKFSTLHESFLSLSLYNLLIKVVALCRQVLGS